MVKFEYGEKQCLDIQLRKCQSLCWPSNPTSVKRYFLARAENPNIGEAVIKSIHCRLLCGGTVNWTVIGTNTTSTEVCVCHPSQTRSVCMAKSLVTARVVYGGGCAGWLMGGGWQGFWLTLETHARPGKLSSSLAFLEPLCCAGIGKMITGEMTHRGGL